MDMVHSQEYIDQLNQQASDLLSYDPGRAAELSEQARQYASTGNFADEPYRRGVADSLTNLGRVKMNEAVYDDALALFAQALSHYRQLNDERGAATVLVAMGGIHFALANYPQALELELAAQSIAWRIGDRPKQSKASNIIGMIYLLQGEPQKALGYFERSLELGRVMERPQDIAEALDNISSVHLKAGEIDVALAVSHESLRLYRELDDKRGAAQVLLRLGEIYLAQAEHAQAETYLRECLQICDRYQAVGALVHLSHIADDRMALLKQALETAEAIQSKQQLFTVHRLLSEAYKQVGDYEIALYHHERFFDFHHQVFNEEADERRRNLEISHQLEVAMQEALTYQTRNATLRQEMARRQQAEDELKERVSQLSVVLQVFDEVSSTLNIDHVLLIALDAALRLSGGSAGFIALVENDSLKIARAIGAYESTEEPISLQSGIVNRVRQSHAPYLVHDPVDGDLPRVGNTLARLVIPLVLQDQFVGLVNLETAYPERFDENVSHLLQLLAVYITVALENARLHHQTRSQLDELQRLYQQVSQLEQLKTDMIRVAAHDLRSPLSVIQGYTQLLDMQAAPENKDYVDQIRHAARRMNTMLENILSLERIEQMAKMEGEEVFNLYAQLVLAIEEFQPLAKAKSQRLRPHLGKSDLMAVPGDANQVHEAIANLLSNAIKYTPNEGDIDVRLITEDNMAVVTVEDTGYGIPESLQKRLFQPFYRAKTDETEHIEGTGLGLHLVKNIVERHNGQMIVHSVYGKGSIFGFMLPIA